MKGKTQRETNPYKYTDSNKRYRTYDYFLREKFSGKVAKIPLSAGFTCPNIDGKKGKGGCIYCASGSGKFNAPAELSIKNQYDEKKMERYNDDPLFSGAHKYLCEVPSSQKAFL